MLKASWGMWLFKLVSKYMGQVISTSSKGIAKADAKIEEAHAKILKVYGRGIEAREAFERMLDKVEDMADKKRDKVLMDTHLVTVKLQKEIDDAEKFKDALDTLLK